MDGGRLPEQFGVVLRFAAEHHLELEPLRSLLAERVTAVPRLRRRLVRTPFGCGGPVWVDDPAFDIRDHVHAARCSPPGDEPALLELAWRSVARRLPRDAPLWSMVLVTDLAGGGAALVIVVHHALADGIGGLAVLTDLVDPGATAPATDFPAPVPLARVLARDAVRARWRAARDLRVTTRQLRASLAASGGLRPPRAQPCSLLAPTGPRRRLLVLHHDPAALRRAVHPVATVNDALLVAVAEALQHVLGLRGEAVERIVVGVPVSGRAPSQRAELGNMVSPLLVAVPTAGNRVERLAAVAAQVRTGRSRASGPAPVAVLGWLFRPLAALGGFRTYMRHQRRLHTLVSHVRGPGGPVTLAGVPITSAVPVGAGDDSNVTVYVEALSYAGDLAITALVDPDRFPEGDDLVDALHRELDALAELPAPPGRSRRGEEAAQRGENDLGDRRRTP